MLYVPFTLSALTLPKALVQLSPMVACCYMADLTVDVAGNGADLLRTRQPAQHLSNVEDRIFIYPALVAVFTPGVFSFCAIVG